MESVFNDQEPLDAAALLMANRRLREAYPALGVVTIGRSVLGRPITLYLLGEGRHETLYVGGVHAMEYITSMLLVRFIERLCASLANGQPLCGLDVAGYLKEHIVAILPMLNPDGVEIHLHGAQTAGPAAQAVQRIAKGDYSHWQANARGVDLNHNFNAGFAGLRRQEMENGIHGPMPGRFGGYSAESEPETRALCGLCRRMLFAKTIAFHSQGEELYWKYGPRTPKSAERMAQSLAQSAGYAVREPQGMAANGGFKDWFIQAFGRPGFTVEVGKGRNPLPPKQCPTLYTRLEPLMALGLQL